MMTSEECAKIIAKNLKRLAYEHDKNQVDIARDLDLKQSTLSSWMRGTRCPPMTKIDMLCEYFGCRRTDIIDDNGYTMPKPPTEEELELLYAFRDANPGIQDSVRILLGIKNRDK